MKGKDTHVLDWRKIAKSSLKESSQASGSPNNHRAANKGILFEDVIEKLLLAMQPGALIIDLASGSGGTDFAAAEKLGLAAVHALSLPGKVAPQTAGELLARAYPQLIRRVLASEQEERSEFWGRAVKL